MYFNEVYYGGVGILERENRLNVKFWRTWFQCRSHDKVKGLIKGMKGLEVKNPIDILERGLV
jgi:hypothetical protein